MKKIILSVALIVVFAAYVFYQHQQNSNSQTLSDINSTPITQQQPAATDTAAATAPVVTPTPTPVAAKPAPTPAPAPVVQKPAGQFKDGTFTGSVADALYGNIQVAAIISGGKLADVKILQYPNDRGHSIEIAQASLPQLRSEAIAAQSANVDIVSGATQDSLAFSQSLQSALDQAKN